MSVRKLIIFDFDGVLREMSWMRMHDAYRISIEFHGKKADDYFTDLVSFKKWYNIDWRKNVGSIFAGTNVTCDQFNEVFDGTFDVPAGQGLTLSGLNLVVAIKKGFKPQSAATSAGTS